MKRSYRKKQYELNYIVTDNGCYISKEHKCTVGIGHIQTRRSLNGIKYNLLHRYAYAKKVGKIPKGLCVLHKCDNPKCINTDHLFLGTQKQNLEDMRLKKRDGHTAMRSGSRKLDDNQVIEIRLIGKKLTQRKIAKYYGVNQSQIHLILSRKSWSSL